MVFCALLRATFRACFAACGEQSNGIFVFERCLAVLLFIFFYGGVFYFGFDFFGNITHKDYNGHGAVIFFGSTVKIADECERAEGRDLKKRIRPFDYI